MVLVISRQKLNTDPSLTSHIKIKSKWIMDLSGLKRKICNFPW